MAEIVLKNLTKDYRSNEAYKTLRTNIEFSGSDKKVIVFTSCTPNEGKSTVSMGLAASLAEGGKRVLFVDADLRKSVLVGRHRVTGEVKGLTHFLSGQADVKEVILRTQEPNLFVTFAVNEYFIRLESECFTELFQLWNGREVILLFQT